MNLVNESLIEFKDDQLIHKMLLEGFNFNDLKKISNPKAVVKDLIKKTNVESNNLNRIKMIGALIILTGYLLFPRSTMNNKDVETKAAELSHKLEYIELDDLKEVTTEMLYKSNSSIDITEEKIDKLNTVIPKRFSFNKIDQYNKYDKDILTAVRELKAAGEKPDAKLIKAIMVVETGMVPRKNSLGYEGFPQTKMHIVQGINKKFKKSFSQSDLYDAKESAKFIHYMIKSIKRSKYVDLDSEAVAAYNWGLGNFSKFKNGEKDLPIETTNYIKMIETITK